MNIKPLLKLTALAVTIAALAAPQLQAASYGVLGTIGGTSTTIIGSTATNLAQLTAKVNVSKWDTVCVDASFKYAVAATSAVDIMWALGADGTNPNNLITVGANGGYFSMTANGTTTVRCVTNITVGAAGYIHFPWVTNGNAGVCSNFTIKVYGKPKRQG